MKQFRQLMERQEPARKTRTLSFQGLVVKQQHNHRYGKPTNTNLDKIQQQALRPTQPKTARDRIQSHPTINLKRCLIKKPQPQKIQGIAIVTSMTASSEQNTVQMRLNTEEREEITEKMEDIKQELMKEVVKNKRKLSLDLNGTLYNIKRELDWRTERLVDDVLAKRNNKELYLKAREEVKVYFSKKKENNMTIREKTLGTPCFEEDMSNTKNTKESNSKSFNSIQHIKPLPSTGCKLTVTRKTGNSTKSIKDTIIRKRYSNAHQDDVCVHQFKIQ